MDLAGLTGGATVMVYGQTEVTKDLYDARDAMGGIVITPLTVFWIDTLDWRTTWQLLAVGTAVIMYPVALMMRRAPEDHGLHPDGKTAAQMAAGQGKAAQADFARSLTRAQALRTWTFYALVLAFGLFSINIVVVLLQAVPLLTDAGFSRNDAALGILVASVPALVSKPVWGWLIGPFVAAHWRVYQDAAQARQYLLPLLRQLHDHGVGSMSEIFDGDPPHRPRGAPAQAWSVACVLEAYSQLSAC